MLYRIEETFLYQVEADTPEEARKLFEDFMSNGEEENGVEFLDNQTDIIDEEGRTH